MGICVTKRKDKQIIYSSKAILHPDNFQRTDFYFESQNLLRVHAQCLVLFCDEKANLAKNSFLVQAGTHEAKKVAEFADAYIASNRSKLEPGEVIMFPINIPSLRFRRVCVGCLKIWDGRNRIKVALEQTVERITKQISSTGIRSVVWTQFNEQFGIPIQIGCKVTISALEKIKDSITTITFVCNNISSVKYYMEKLSQNKLEQSSVYRQSKQSSLSNYY